MLPKPITGNKLCKKIIQKLDNLREPEVDLGGLNTFGDCSLRNPSLGRVNQMFQKIQINPSE